MELLKRLLPFAFCFLSFIILLRVLLLSNFPDFKVNYYGAKHLLSHENPYAPDERYFTPQVYPPVDMVFFIPMTILSQEIAAKTWVIISIIAVHTSIYLLAKTYSLVVWSPAVLIFATGAFLSFPFKFTLGMGQVNAVLLFFITLSFYFLMKKRDSISGIILVFPLLVKFYPLLFLPYLVFLKKWKILTTIFLTGSILLFISLYFVSFENQLYFFREIFPSLLTSWKGDYYNQALSGFLMRGVTDPWIRSLLRISIGGLMLLVTGVIIFLTGQKKQDVAIASILTVSILVNNFSWQHHYLFLLVPFFIVMRSILLLKQNKMYLFLLLLSYVLISFNIKTPEQFPALVLSHVFYGGVILWVVTLRLLREN